MGISFGAPVHVLIGARRRWMGQADRQIAVSESSDEWSGRSPR
jgi:hypothetical protein